MLKDSSLATEMPLKPSIIGERLKDLMTTQRVKESDLAEATGIAISTLYQLLRSPSSNPRAETMLALSRFFSVSVDYLLGHNLPTKSKPSGLEEARSKKPWNADLYTQALHQFTLLQKKNNVTVTAKESLRMIEEIYFFSLDKSAHQIDAQFAEWIISQHGYHTNPYAS